MSDWLTAALAFLAPGLAASRVRNQARFVSAQRLYQAVEHSHYRPRRGSGASGDAVMDAAKGRMREFGRFLDENMDIATGVLDDLVVNTVGTGVGIEPMARDAAGNPADKVNKALGELWAEFWEAPEITGEIPGPELERMICRSWLRDGEVFVQHLTRPSPDGIIPYALQPLESDFIPFDLIDPRRNTVHGVIKDGFGRPGGYHVYTAHPGDSASAIWGSALVPETVIVSAANMTHLKFTRRLHQTRGVSVLHSVLARIDDLKEYEESERVAARIAAAFSAYIKREGVYDANIDGTTGERVFEMAPGAIFDSLQPGEDIGTIDSNRPNDQVSNYITIQERRIAAGTGSRYSSVSKNYNGTYSAQRQELVEGVQHYRRLFAYLTARFHRPVWRRFIDAARLSGRLPALRGIDLASLYRPEIRPPSLPWIDPKKEIEAHAIAVERGFRSRWQVIRDLGGDPRTVDQQLAADAFDVRPPQSVESAPAAQDDDSGAPPSGPPTKTSDSADDEQEAA